MATATLKLYAMLADYLPAAAQRNKISIPIDGTIAITDIIAAHNLPPKLCHLVLLNGVFVAPDNRAETLLKDGDTLAIWPPVAGG